MLKTRRAKWIALGVLVLGVLLLPSIVRAEESGGVDSQWQGIVMDSIHTMFNWVYGVFTHLLP